MNWSIVILCFTIAILFVSMVLSSMSATASSKSDSHNAKKYSTWSALISVFAFLLLFGFMAFKSGSWTSITLVLSMLLLYTVMILSSISSNTASSSSKDSHNYAVYSSVLAGVTVAILIIFLVLFINKEKVAELANQGYGMAQDLYDQHFNSSGSLKSSSPMRSSYNPTPQPPPRGYPGDDLDLF